MKTMQWVAETILAGFAVGLGLAAPLHAQTMPMNG